MSKRRQPRSMQRRIALKRIGTLMELARSEIVHPERARRYVLLSKAISMRCKVRMPPRWRRKFCRRCGLPLIPGRTSKVRLRRSRVNVTCAGCGMVHRYPYRRRTT